MPQFDLTHNGSDFTVETDNDGDIREVQVYVEGLGTYMLCTDEALKDSRFVMKVSELYQEHESEKRNDDWDHRAEEG